MYVCSYVVMVFFLAGRDPMPVRTPAGVLVLPTLGDLSMHVLGAQQIRSMAEDIFSIVRTEFALRLWGAQSDLLLHFGPPDSLTTAIPTGFLETLEFGGIVAHGWGPLRTTLDVSESA